MFHSAYQTFTTIVETGSLAGAAKRLNLSPSAISKQLSTLEERLGVKLLQRSTRSLQLTDAGELYHLRCLRIMQVIDEAESEVREIGNLVQGTLTLSIPEVLATPRIARLLHEFCANQPGLTLDIRVSNEVENLIAKQVDIAFRVGPLEDSRLVSVPLMQTQSVICAAPSYIDEYGVPDSLAQLTERRFLVPSYLNIAQHVPGILDTGSNLDLERHIRCDSATMMLEMTKAGMGIAIMLHTLAEQAINSGELIKLFPEQSLEPVPVHMVYISRDYMPQKLRLFIDFCR